MHKNKNNTSNDEESSIKQKPLQPLNFNTAHHGFNDRQSERQYDDDFEDEKQDQGKNGDGNQNNFNSKLKKGSNNKVKKYSKIETCRGSIQKNQIKNKTKLPSVHTQHTRKFTSNFGVGNIGRYRRQIQERFQRGKINNKTSIETLNKINLQMKELIKQYNEDLKQIITKNLKQFLHKQNQQHLTKSTIYSHQQQQILQNQIQNNVVLQQNQLKQINSLKKREKRIEKLSVQCSDVLDLTDKQEEEAVVMRNHVKQLENEIKNIRSKIENQGKLLIPFQREIHASHQSSIGGKYNILKHKIYDEKLNVIKNTKISENLDNKIAQLKSRLQSAEFLQKTQKASKELTSKKRKQKDGKYLQKYKKKLETAKNHKTKAQSLYDTKTNILHHDNNLIKEQLQASDIQIQDIDKKNQIINVECLQLIEQLKRSQKLQKNMIEKLKSIGFFQDYFASKETNENNQRVIGDNQPEYRVWKQSESNQLKNSESPNKTQKINQIQQNQHRSSQFAHNQNQNHSKNKISQKSID